MQSADGENREVVSAEESQQTQKQQKQGVGLRWLTAVVAIPVVLVFTLLGGWFAFAAALAAMGLATWEIYKMFLHESYHPLIGISFFLNVLFLVSTMLPLSWHLLLLEIAFAVAVLLPVPWMFFRGTFEGAIIDWALTWLIAVYVGWPMSLFLQLRGYESGLTFGGSGLVLHLPHGVLWLLVLFLGVWGFDSAAFFCGRYFGRHKLAPSISPGKTWEGVLGGLVVSVLACLVVMVVPLGKPWYLAVILGILIGISAVLGDLTESLIKRQTHVKDSGQFMPGHGGMLDRIDSLLFAAVVIFLFTQFIGM